MGGAGWLRGSRPGLRPAARRQMAHDAPPAGRQAQDGESGVYRVIDRPRRLVFTWAWDEDDGSRGHETEVTVTFDAAPGGTRLRLLQQTFQNAEVRDKHNG